MSEHDHGQAHSHGIRDYLIVYVLLLVLLVATVGISYIPLGAFNFVVAMVIACMKAAMVLWVFMHLREANRLNVIFMTAGVVMLLVAFTLTFSDYLTRW